MHPPSAFAPDPCSLPLCSVRSHSAFCRPVSALRPPDDRTQNSAAAPSPTCSYPVQRRPSLLLIDAHTALRHTSSTVALPSFSPLCPASLHGPRPRRSTRPLSHTAERRPGFLLRRRPSSRPSRSRRHLPQAAPPSFSDRRPQARRCPSTGSGPSRRRGPRPARGHEQARQRLAVTSTPSPGQAQACARARLLYTPGPCYTR